MKASFRETKAHGLTIWVCELNGKEIARSMSEQGVRHQVLKIIRKNSK